MGIGRVVRKSVLSVIVVGVVILLVHAYVIQVYAITSVSMSPTLLPGDSVFVNRLAYRLHSPHRGDLIAFRFPQAAGREFVKRVIGLPGDVVSEQGGHLYVNGALLAQAQPMASIAESEPDADQPPRPVPAGQLYVLGDNRASSLDSRFWGPVRERDVLGEAFLICWSHGRRWWQVRWTRLGRGLP
ncbi:MAG TPA: signal peptidase I [archaeon]|nr:signal peptidase I [archaeon]